VIELAAIAWASLHSGAVATALLRAHRRRASATPSPKVDLDAVLLVRPCAGDEPDLARRLAKAGGASNVVLALEALEDGAAPGVLGAAAELRDLGVTAHVTLTGARGPNHKAAQLASAIRSYGPGREIVVVADSDVELGDNDVDELVSELTSSGATSIWAPPFETVEDDPLSLSSAVLGGSMHSFPLLAGIDRAGFVGKLFAVRRAALDETGGFDSLVDRLGEDTELARRLRAEGGEVRASRVVASVRPRGRDVRALMERLTRWFVVIRLQRPLLLPTYPLFIAPSPLSFALLATGLAVKSPIVFVAASILLAGRAVVAVATPWMLRGTPPHTTAPLVGIVADAIMLVALVRALFVRTIAWRGRTLALAKRGRLTLLASEEAHQPREESLGHPADGRRRGLLDNREVVRARASEGTVDAFELRADRVELRLESSRNVADARLGCTDRDPELRPLAPSEDIADTDRHDPSTRRHTSDRCRSRTERERLERGLLSTLRIEPDDSARCIEQSGRLANRLRTVGWVGEVDPECPHLAEERKAQQVRRVHHREGVARHDEVGQPERDERIPPRRMVRDHEHGRTGARPTEVLGSSNPNASKHPADPRTRVTREHRREPSTLRRRDHRRRSS
jgi:ceramide glucosyltransferase